MKLDAKTLQKLKLLINEETEYRSGPKLVAFFNQLGFNDHYGPGFPSRGAYTSERLNIINGTPEIDKCLKLLFSPVNFLEKINNLDNHIGDFNRYLMFCGWKLSRQGKEIIFKKATDADIQDELSQTEVKISSEEDFLKKDFAEVSLDNLKLEGAITEILKQRLIEIKSCLSSKSALAVIFLCGSTLEGILLGIASNNPAIFNKSNSSPKERITGKTLPFDKWTLSNFIDVAKETGFIQEDVKQFSHVLRAFRNYIHPFQQRLEEFNPSEHTAKLCWQTLKLAIIEINQKVI
ncbi:MAG: hypothetical protein WCP97_01250 [bacterium]